MGLFSGVSPAGTLAVSLSYDQRETPDLVALTFSASVIDRYHSRLNIHERPISRLNPTTKVAHARR
jgi:hypothetical protein